MAGLWLGAMLLLNPGFLTGGTQAAQSALQLLPGAVLMALSAVGVDQLRGACHSPRAQERSTPAANTG